MGCVYLVTNKINGMRYVGRTLRTLDTRWKEHIKGDRRRKSKFQNAVDMYGHENFSLGELFQSESVEELNQKEIFYISSLNTLHPEGYNLSKGGKGSPGLKLSDETKLKLSRINKGKKLSEETRLKISRGGRGRKLSEEAKKKISASNTGKVRTEENKRRISETLTGKPNGWEGRRHSEEAKIKMSLSKKGKKRPPFSEETKRKIGLSKIGKKRPPHSEETRKKISLARRGRPTRGKNYVAKEPLNFPGIF